jgi:hypothetical protein
MISPLAVPIFEIVFNGGRGPDTGREQPAQQAAIYAILK